jgi:ribosomal protein L10
VKSKQLILTLAVALSVVGCQNDDAAIKALQDVTAGQTAKVMEQNKTLENLMTQIETCRAELAEAKGEAAVIKYKDVSFDVPTLMGEAKVQPKATVETLEELKKSLAETLDKQAAKLADLEADADQCRADLATSKADAEKADAAAAAEESDK